MGAVVQTMNHCFHIDLKLWKHQAAYVGGPPIFFHVLIIIAKRGDQAGFGILYISSYLNHQIVYVYSTENIDS